MMNKEVEEIHTKLNKQFNEEGQHAVELFKVVAVGWLNSSEEFEKGSVPNNFLICLRTLWSRGIVIRTLGHHECDFCEGGYGTGERATSSSENFLIDKENKIKYIFPEMIFHYIEEHNFLPNKEFIKFVMEHNL